jgi:hypothetical protein
MALLEIAAILAAFILGLVMLLHLLLTIGLPLGQMAWGGQHMRLPMRLRWSSLVSFFILGGAAWIVLARAGLVAPGADHLVVRVLVWVLAGLFALNTLGNLASKSPAERTIMTPTTLLLVACFVTVGLLGP